MKKSLIILLITLLLSFGVWTTKNIFSCKNAESNLIELKIDIEKQNDDIISSIKDFKKEFKSEINKLDNKLDNINERMQLNQKNTYEILLEIQKQI